MSPKRQVIFALCGRNSFFDKKMFGNKLKLGISLSSFIKILVKKWLLRGRTMFASDTTQSELENFIREWQVDGLTTKGAFVALKEILEKNENSLISFHARPGITCSLRAQISKNAGQDGPLYAMVDVIDDDPEQRWLSACFYGDRISDPEERGDFVPGGLLGQDAICFDYDAENGELLDYIKERIVESYKSSMAAV